MGFAVPNKNGKKGQKMNIVDYWASLLENGEITESTPIYIIDRNGNTLSFYDGKNSIDNSFNDCIVKHCTVWNRNSDGIAQLIELTI